LEAGGKAARWPVTTLSCQLDDTSTYRNRSEVFMTASPSSATLEWLPDEGEIRQLFILLHGEGAAPPAMRTLALALRTAFPQSAVLAPAGFEAQDEEGMRRQWFSERGITEANRAERAAQALPALVAWVRAAQARFHLLQTDTALAGFSQGATLALQSTQDHDGLAGRIIAFSGRYAQLPTHPPQLATLHLLHGQDDSVIPVTHAQAAHDKLSLLHGDATLDIATHLGHELHPVLIRQAIVRLQTCVPLRSWEAALGLNQAPPTGVPIH
jgi:phospholipase/carboxylesterase